MTGDEIHLTIDTEKRSFGFVDDLQQCLYH